MKTCPKFVRAAVLCLCAVVLCLCCAACTPKPTVEGQTISLTGVENARELGGYKGTDGKTVKHGVLLRSATLENASEEDVQRLQDVYHLSLIIDLRSADEAEESPDVAMEGARYINLSSSEGGPQDLIDKVAEFAGPDDDLNDPDTVKRLLEENGLLTNREDMPDMLVSLLEKDSFKECATHIFELLLDQPEGEAALVHCREGKDRTGAIALLVLSALGVDEDTIAADYLLSNDFYAAEHDGQDASESDSGALNADVPPYTFDWAKENYGSTLDYIHDELGITDEQIETLRAKYLE